MGTKAVKFFYNGMKINGSKLIKGSFCYHAEFTDLVGVTYPEQVTFYASEYGNEGLFEVFKVENNTDSATDYFEKDRIRFAVGHPMFAEAKAMFDKREAKFQARMAKRNAGSARTASRLAAEMFSMSKAK